MRYSVMRQTLPAGNAGFKFRAVNLLVAPGHELQTDHACQNASSDSRALWPYPAKFVSEDSGDDT